MTRQLGAQGARVRFMGSIPVPQAPGLSTGGEIGFGWQNEQVGTSYHEGCDKEGRFVYRPLFQLKKVRPEVALGYRDASEPKTGDET